MSEHAVSVGKLFAMYSNDSWSAQAEGAGWSIRFGRHLFVLGHIDYRDRKKKSWPRWLSFSITFWRPAQ